MTLEKFDILEEKVSQLAERYTELKNQQGNVVATIEQKDKEVADLQEKIHALEEEREVAASRLDKIISTLEKLTFNS